MSEVLLNGRRLSLNPRSVIGQGGEADVYDIGGGIALKLYKTSTHPEFHHQPLEQRAANSRLRTQQRKLPDLLRLAPKLPGRLVVPQTLVYDRSGQSIAGYTMPLIQPAEVLHRYSDRGWRQNGIPSERLPIVFRDLHRTIIAAHQAGFVFGDLTDLNILVKDAEAYAIDVDSGQFGPYPCQLFSQKYVDPLLCQPGIHRLQLVKTMSPNSDWYAYAVMFMECLLYVHPYGGVYRPKAKNAALIHDARPLQRVTIFHPEVVYPKPALPLDVLPDELREYFQQVFVKDRREVFSPKILDNLHWRKCSQCGLEHGRAVCPQCKQQAPAAVVQRLTVRGQVTARQVFRTSGTILFAAKHHGEIIWLYHEAGAFRREGNKVILHGDLDPSMRFRLRGADTMIGSRGLLVTLRDSEVISQDPVDSYRQLPVFDANDHHRYWLSQGRLLRDDQFGSFPVGAVLQGQTLFWVGPQFGFGYSHAGQVQMAFTFDAERRGMNDRVLLPRMNGQPIDSTCVFGSERAWFFQSAQDHGRTINRCTVITPAGEIVATAETTAGDGSWLGTIRGKMAVGQSLLAATDEGIVRVEIVNGHPEVVRTFPDTEPFVDAAVHLFPMVNGLAVVGRHTITTLTLSPTGSSHP